MTDRPRSTNLTPDLSRVSPSARRTLLGHSAACIWLTGLSGSGKSTVARAAEETLIARGSLAYVLDGDNLRGGLNRDLTFSPEDRAENIRRIGEVANLFVDAGIIVICAFISPYRADRDQVRATVGASFIEVFLNPSLEVCEERDPKGLYAKARSGAIPNFTGVSAPYEAPERPELELDTGSLSIDEATESLVRLLETRAIL
ncbi:MAG TPA: adenylyl-sulfate kinase [Deltaproteobacteria bacterium]|nr:adenylyl-sulfate kinase [Deltaproteobacteria bacterium]HCP48393.1 adenylyl-sulfate kinase [Deltaproteobacteria bacterium]